MKADCDADHRQKVESEKNQGLRGMQAVRYGTPDRIDRPGRGDQQIDENDDLLRSQCPSGRRYLGCVGQACKAPPRTRFAHSRDPLSTPDFGRTSATSITAHCALQLWHPFTLRLSRANDISLMFECSMSRVGSISILSHSSSSSENLTKAKEFMPKSSNGVSSVRICPGLIFNRAPRRAIKNSLISFALLGGGNDSFDEKPPVPKYFLTFSTRGTLPSQPEMGTCRHGNNLNGEHQGVKPPSITFRALVLLLSRVLHRMSAGHLPRRKACGHRLVSSYFRCRSQCQRQWLEQYKARILGKCRSNWRVWSSFQVR